MKMKCLGGYLKIATVEFTHKEPTSNIRFLGDHHYQWLGNLGNVIEIMEGVRNAVKELNEDYFAKSRIKLEQFMMKRYILIPQ